MLRIDRDGRRRGFRISLGGRAQQGLAETAAEFVWLKIGHHCRGGKLPCRYVAAQREGSTRTSACHSSIVGSPNATIITVRRRLSQRLQLDLACGPRCICCKRAGSGCVTATPHMDRPLPDVSPNRVAGTVFRSRALGEGPLQLNTIRPSTPVRIAPLLLM
jgi:hypothetical protein